MSSSNDIATTALRRSQLYRRHIEMGAVFEALSDGTAGNSAVVSHYRTSEEELTQAQHLGLADLSTLPRMGFKGLGTPGWAAAYCLTNKKGGGIEYLNAYCGLWRHIALHRL